MYFRATAIFLTSLFTVQACAAPVNPENVEFIVEDAERFAALYERSNGLPSANDLDQEYILPGTKAITVFMKGRIRNSEHLAQKIKENPALYRRGIDVCLPAAQAATPELRAVYKRFTEIIDNPKLPEAYAVFGANSSGGTAGKKSIVLGLEVICRIAPGDKVEIRAWLKQFFAHEVVHALQVSASNSTLLAATISEGSADFIALFAAEGTINDEAAIWYQQNKAEVWAKFEKDMATLKKGDYGLWLYAGKSKRPEGWPRDLGYVIGADIARAYYDNADDKKQAIRDILKARRRSKAFLIKSGYAEQFSAQKSQ